MVLQPTTKSKLRWRRELLDRMDKYFKQQLTSLVEDGDYNSTDETDRYNLLKLEVCNIGEQSTIIIIIDI